MQMTEINTAAATEVNLTIRVPLGAKLRMAPENVRKVKKDDDLGPLCDSIASEIGLLNPPTGYEEDGIYYVTAGNRRRRALERLKKERRLPEDIKALGVPFILKPKALALEISFAENAQREAMTVQEELRGYQALSEKGLDAAGIAIVTGSTHKRVAQLLSLTHVAPTILDAFLDAKISMECLQAFTLTQDHDRQLQVWGRWEGRQVSAHGVRNLLMDSTMPARDAVAQFVGRDAYVAAGGTFVVDLFQDDDDKAAAWADGALAHQLHQDKLDKIAEGLIADGWAAVEVAKDRYGYSAGLARDYPERREPTEDEAAQKAALIAKSSDGEIPEEDRAQARQELASLNASFEVWTDEQKAAGTVFLVMDWNGDLKIEKGFFVPQTADGAAGSGKAKEKPDFGHEGHQRMTRIATTSTRNAVALNPAVAYDTTVAHQAWMVLRNKSDHGYALPFAKPGCEPAEGIAIKGDREWEDLYAEWDERLPNKFLDFYPAVFALTAEEKASLLALVVATQLDGLESRADYRRPRAWAQLGLIAAHAKVNIADRWTPDAEFLKGAGKKALLRTIGEMGQNAEAFASEKKTALVEIAARHAAKARWVPAFLRSFVEPTLSDKDNISDSRKASAGSDVADMDDMVDEDLTDEVFGEDDDQSDAED